VSFIKISAGLSKECRYFVEVFRSLLEDWGAFLELPLYREAVMHFMGGKDVLLKPIDIYSGNDVLGTQKFSLINDDTAFHLSALPNNLESYEKHMSRLLQHTRLQAIQWVNMNKNHIIFKTISTKK